jgi:hypothetical protein
MHTHRRRRARRSAPQSPLSLPRLPVGFDPLVVCAPRPSGSVERQLGLWLELDPRVVEYGRAVDVHEDAGPKFTDEERHVRAR